MGDECAGAKSEEIEERDRVDRLSTELRQGDAHSSLTRIGLDCERLVLQSRGLAVPLWLLSDVGTDRVDVDERLISDRRESVGDRLESRVSLRFLNMMFSSRRALPNEAAISRSV